MNYTLHHNIQEFCCGDDDLDIFLRKQVPEFCVRGVGVTRVAVNNDDPDYVLGFQHFTVTDRPHHSLGVPRLRRNERFPVMLLRALAVRENQQRQGIGRLLFFDALNYALRAQVYTGIHGVFFETLPGAEQFYKQKLQLPAVVKTGRQFYLSIEYILELLPSDQEFLI